MAANLAALNNYFQNTLVIQDQAVRDGLNEQGLTSFDDFVTLTEKDIVQICANVRRPGGVIPNPNAAVVGQPPTITNPGVLVGHAVKIRLKMLCYFVKHLVRVQRMPFVPGVATLARLVAVYKLKEIEEVADDDEEIKLPSPLTKIDDVRVTLEDIDDYLRRKFGDSGCPLAYVTRDTVALPVIDAGFGLPTFAEEMIARAPHIDISYQRDNVVVWNVIRHVTHGGPGWNWVSSFRPTRDGRAAYIALKTHYMGDSFVSRIRSSADSRLDNAYYDGKSRNFTFEQYCALLNNAFADLEATGEVVTESCKLRVFMTGLKDSRLDVAKSQIQATPALQVSFEAAVTFTATFLESHRLTANVPRGRDVSNVNRGRDGGRGGRGRGRGRGSGRDGRGGRGHGGKTGGRGNGSGRGSNAITDRYYTPEEWERLTAEERQTVRDKRSERDRRRGVDVVNRNVRARSDDDEASTAQVTIAAAPNQSAVSSRRGSANAGSNHVSFQHS